MSPCRVLLVDDSPVLLRSLGHYFALMPGVEVVGQALCGQEAIEKAAELRPGLVFVDLAMPGMNGLEVTRRLKRSSEGPCVLIFSLHGDTEHREAARVAGADGFLAKDEFGLCLIPMIEAIAAKK